MSNQKKLLHFLFALIFSLISGFSIAQEFSQKTFSFTLKSSALTSAGVYKDDGTLVRTLWGNKKYDAGNHIEVWDGLTDDGDIAATDENYQIKVLSNNVQYTWEGVIGNTSNSLTGITVHHHPQGAILDMAISGNTAYYVTGYNEGHAAEFKFNLDQPQVKKQVFPSDDMGQSSYYVATDGIKVYWAGNDAFEKKYRKDYAAFVFATNVVDDKEVIFSSGKPYAVTIGKTHKSVISFQRNTNEVINISGLAVQKKGNYLFVARKDLNIIDVLNKSTGALITTISSLTLPRNLKVDGNDNLWIITGDNKVSRYVVKSNGTIGQPDIALAGLVKPLSLGFSPDNSTITVIDGGTSQQLKSFSTNTGTPKWTFGQEGGYANGPDVTNEKFYFATTKIFKVGHESATNATIDRSYTFITYTPDGSFWVSDLGNCRVQHYSANRTFIESVQNLGYFYSMQADVNNPTRVFANYLEFAIDYSKSLDNGKNGSWKLVKNWSYSIDPARYDNQYQRFKDVTTLSNGRTYAIIKDNVRGTGVLVELPPTGNLRFTGIETSSYNVNIRNTLNADGSLGNITSELNKPGFWQRRPLKGFDSKNNPVWGPLETLATIPQIKGEDPIANGQGSLIRNPLTSTDLVVTFNPDNPYDKNNPGKVPSRSYGYHLGAIKSGNDKWLWRTSYITNPLYTGPFPDDGAFDVGNGVGFAGGFAGVVDRNIFWSYHGEFWKSSQTNKFNHYFDDGLMVGQFGITGPEANELAPEAAPMFAGNALTGTFVKVGNDIYLYHADEGGHGGIHRWKISGLNTIEEQIADFVTTAKEPLPGINLMKGLPNYSPLVDGAHGWSRKPSIEDENVLSATTNYYTYKKNSLDLLIKLSSVKGVPTSGTVTRDLGNNSNLSEWTITGSIAYLLASEPDTDFIEILDKSSKVICRIRRNEKFYFNNTAVISSSNYKTVYNAIKDLNPINITANKNGITFKYNNLEPITVTPLDNSADWRSPKTLRIYLYDANGRGHKVDIANFRFSINSYQASSDNTPLDAPTLSSNDVKNTLSASHPLGNAEIEVSVNNEPFKPYVGQILVGNVTRSEGYWKFRTRATSQRKESSISESPEFTYINTTPVPPTLKADDVVNTLSASHTLALSEIIVSENGGPFSAYSGQINVGNVARPAGYWKFKIKSSLGRNESELVLSPVFNDISTPPPPTLIANDVANTLDASHPLGIKQILISTNGGPFVQYTQGIYVGYVARPKGYWKFKVKSAVGRNESEVVESTPFTITPKAPTIKPDDAQNVLTAYHELGSTEIVVSENDGPYVNYSAITVGNIARPAGYYKFKIKSAEGRSESPVTLSPVFNYTSTPDAPTLIANDEKNTLTASHSLGTSVILVSVNNGPYVGYNGGIYVYNVARPAGYWKFKIKAASNRYESKVVESPAFKSTPSTPILSTNDVVNTITLQNSLTSTDVVVSENDKPYEKFGGLIKVGDVSRPQGYWKFKVEGTATSTESAIVESPDFFANTNPIAPTITASDETNILRASHPLGDAQIKMSINNGEFYGYYGEIKVGNNSYPKGYWRFKIDAKAGRNESPIVESPPFTRSTNTRVANMQTGSDSLAISQSKQEKQKDFKVNLHGNKSSETFADTTSINSLRNTTEYQPLNKWENKLSSQKVTVYPNPITSSNFNIRLIDFPKGNYNLNLINTSGSVIMSRQISYNGDNTHQNINIERNLPPGIYIIEVRGRDTSITSKIIRN